MAATRFGISGLLCIIFLASLLVSSEAFFGTRVGNGKRSVEVKILIDLLPILVSLNVKYTMRNFIYWPKLK